MSQNIFKGSLKTKAMTLRRDDVLLVKKMFMISMQKTLYVIKDPKKVEVTFVYLKGSEQTFHASKWVFSSF